MALENWGATETARIVEAPVSAPPPAFELRPLTLGEILDRIMTVYRSRFWLFAGLASVSAAMQTLVAAVPLFFLGAPKTLFNPERFTPAMVGGGAVAIVLAYLVFFMALSVTQAATAYALGEVYLGRRVTIKESLKATIGKWYRYIGIAIWQGWSMAWIPVLVFLPAFALFATKDPTLRIAGGVLIFFGFAGGFVAGFILYLRNTLAVPATVMEGLTVRKSMRRSKVLAADTKGRIFVVMLLAGALKYAAGLLQQPFLMVVMFAGAQGHQARWAQGISLLVTFIAYTLVEPVLMLGLTLVYFDRRVRMEALDLEMMLGPAVAAPAFVAPADGFAEPAPPFGEAATALPIETSVSEAPSSPEVSEGTPGEPHAL
jgi:hypothetical protein